MLIIPPDLASALTERIEREATPSPGGCLLRNTYVSAGGYTGIDVTREGRRVRYLAHRVVYTHHRGPIPDGLTIDHLCKVRNCVNWRHMEAVAPGVNVLRSDNPAAQNARRDTCREGHELPPRSGGGRRRCEPCRRAARLRRNRESLPPRDRGITLPPDDSRHGTLGGYTNYACRCEECKGAAQEYYIRRKTSGGAR